MHANLFLSRMRTTLAPQRLKVAVGMQATQSLARCTFEIICSTVLIACLIKASSLADAPLGLCIEALLYSYLFTHHQDYFGGRLERVLALDGGRCAHLLVAAAERAYPGGDFGKDSWASMYVPPIYRAAHDYVADLDVGDIVASG